MRYVTLFFGMVITWWLIGCEREPACVVYARRQAMFDHECPADKVRVTRANLSHKYCSIRMTVCGRVRIYRTVHEAAYDVTDGLPRGMLEW